MFFKGHLDSILRTHALYLLNHRSQESHGTQTTNHSSTRLLFFGPIFLLSLTQMPTALSVVVVWVLSVLFGSRDPKCGRRAGEHWGGGWAIPGPWLVLGEGCSTETSLALSLSCWFPVSSCDLLGRGPAMMPPRWCRRDDATCYKLSPVTELCCLDVQLPEPRVK